MKKLLTLLLALPLLWGHAAAQENAKYTILLTGASFASPQNGWFEIGCRQLDARALNRAIGGESIADTANRMAEGTLWNAGEKGRKPGRLAVPQQRITVRSDGMGTAPVIPLIYLTLLSAKLLAMAFPDGCTDAELSGYNDERTMAALTDRVMTVLEQLALRDGEEETRSPAS